MSKLSKLLIKKYDVVSGDYIVLEELDLKCDEVRIESNNNYINIYALVSKKKILDKTFKNCVITLRHNVIEVLL
jgi:non-homologous end joining protein Ku